MLKVRRRTNNRPMVHLFNTERKMYPKSLNKPTGRAETVSKLRRDYHKPIRKHKSKRPRKENEDVEREIKEEIQDCYRSVSR